MSQNAADDNSLNGNGDRNATTLTDLPAPLLVPDVIAARLSGCSRPTWWRLFAAGKTPTCIKLGRKALWDKAEIEEWIRARCPERALWEATRGQRQRLRRV
jgi:predicted DNA-binding transcriptional regulator AlpA